MPNLSRILFRYPFLLFLLYYLAYCILNFSAYGMGWDEESVYRSGRATYDLLIHGVVPAYLEPDHAYPYAALLGPLSAGENYDLLHLLNLLSCLPLFAALYWMTYTSTRRPWVSLAGPLALFLMPQFLGSIPFNPKDVPFATLYFLSLTALRWGEGKRYRWVLLGALFGCAMASRIVGFTLIPLLILHDLHPLLGRKGALKKAWPALALEWGGVVLLSQTVLAVLWPYLGRDYLGRLPQVLALSAKFPVRFEFLYRGALVGSDAYPWDYLLVMLLITTPIFLLTLVALSFWWIKEWDKDRNFFLLGSALLLNLLIALALHPAVYDGVRHFLYLMPLLAGLAAQGLSRAFPSLPATKFQYVLAAWLFLGVVSTYTQTVRLHPYEYIYYNGTVGWAQGAFGRYETDYWVTGMREAVEWLKRNETLEPERTYRIYAQGGAFQSEHWFFPNMKRVEEGEPADYALLMTRAGVQAKYLGIGKMIHRVEADGVPLVYILRMGSPGP